MICLVPVQCISSIRHMYTTDFTYDGPIFLVPLSPSYPSSPVVINLFYLLEPLNRESVDSVIYCTVMLPTTSVQWSFPFSSAIAVPLSVSWVLIYELQVVSLRQRRTEPLSWTGLCISPGGGGFTKQAQGIC